MGWGTMEISGLSSWVERALEEVINVWMDAVIVCRQERARNYCAIPPAAARSFRVPNRM